MKPTPAEAAAALRVMTAYVQAHVETPCLTANFSIHFAWFGGPAICEEKSGHITTENTGFVTCAKCTKKIVHLKEQGEFDRERERRVFRLYEDLDRLMGKQSVDSKK